MSKFNALMLVFTVAAGCCYGQELSARNSPPPEPGVVTENSDSPVTPQLGLKALPGAPPFKTVPDRQTRMMNRLWYASIALMLAGTTADAVTSWHKQEANGLLASSDGTFGGKGLGIKLGLTSAILLPQFLLRHHAGLRKGFAIGNFIDAGIFGGTAIHNASLTAPPR